MLDETQIDFFRRNGYLILRDVLSQDEKKNLQTWVQEVHDWPTDETSPWMPYEVCMAFLSFFHGICRKKVV